MLLTPISNKVTAESEPHQTRQHFTGLLSSNFIEPVQTVASAETTK